MSWRRYRSQRAQSSAPLPLTYEAHLPQFNSPHLKSMARAWTGTAAHKLNKSDCATAILNVLENKESLRAMVQRLSPFEQAGLGLFKLRGDVAPTAEISMELLMLGLPFGETTRSPYYGSQREAVQYEALNCLLKKGLLLLRVMDTRFSYSQEPSVSDYDNRPIVFADPRILAHIQPVPPAILSLKPLSNVEPGLSKQPAEVMLRFITLMEVIRKIGRIDCTTKGRPTKPYMAKLTKRLGWNDTGDAESATPLPETLLFFFKLLEGTELIGPLPNDGGRGVHPEAIAFFESSHEVQAAQWIRAYRSLTGWIEHKPESVWLNEDPSEPGKFNSIRTALLTALAALPDPGAWYRIQDLSDGIYGRIGERFSLSYLHRFHQPFQANQAKIDEERRNWQQCLYEQWSKNEHPWLTSAIKGPLYHLGLVELASESGHEKTSLSLFRLTGLGQAVMQSLFREEQVASSAKPTARRQSRKTNELCQETVPCWVVQPNFEVIVYLNRSSASLLAFIERIAERQPSEGATALYRLTQATVYSGLESGVDPEALLATLTSASEYPLPENIRQTLSDWVSKRERLVVYRSASILEYTDRATRDAALLEKVVTGKPVGERLILLPGKTTFKTLIGYKSRVINYGEPVSPCMTVSEEGLIQIDPTRGDLIVRGEVNSWAEPVKGEGKETNLDDANHWKMTRLSIQCAARAGWTAERIIASLAQRVEGDLPPLLMVAIRAWAAGIRASHTPSPVAIARDVVLQVTDNDVAEAIAASALLQPYLRSRLGPNTFLVRHEEVKTLRKQLAAFGLQVRNDLEFDLWVC